MDGIAITASLALHDPHNHALERLRTLQDDAEKELETGDGGVYGGAGYTQLDLLQLETSQILGRSQIGGAAKEAGEPQNCAQVGGLCLGLEVGEP